MKNSDENIPETIHEEFRNWDCPKYSECLGNAAKTNNKTFSCEGCEMANYTDPDKIEKIKADIKNGMSIRETMKDTGVAKKTVEKYRKDALNETDEPILCECGQPAGHKGWCKERVEKSPKRQEFLKNQAGKFKIVKKQKGRKKKIPGPFLELAKKEYQRIQVQIEKLQKEIKQNIFELQKLYGWVCGLEEYLSTENYVSKLTEREAYMNFIFNEFDMISSEEEGNDNGT